MIVSGAGCVNFDCKVVLRSYHKLDLPATVQKRSLPPQPNYLLGEKHQPDHTGTTYHAHFFSRLFLFSRMPLPLRWLDKTMTDEDHIQQIHVRLP